MPGLVDCFAGPLAVETVEILGRQVDVQGISARGIAQLLARFPELKKQMSGGGGLDFLGVEGEVMAAFIAAGTGALGDEKAEAVAASLPLAAQTTLLAAIMKRTMPQDAGPLAVAAPASAAEEASDTAPATKSSKRSTNSSARATVKAYSGTAHPAS